METADGAGATGLETAVGAVVRDGARGFELLLPAVFDAVWSTGAVALDTVEDRVLAGVDRVGWTVCGSDGAGVDGSRTGAEGAGVEGAGAGASAFETLPATLDRVCVTGAAACETVEATLGTGAEVLV